MIGDTVILETAFARSLGKFKLSLCQPTRTGSEHSPVNRVRGPHFSEAKSQDPICLSPYLYRARNLVERFFNKIKQCRRVATRFDKLAANYLAFIKLAAIRFWLRAYESTS